MAKLNILRYPDPRLQKIARSVTVFDDGIAQLVADMAETMYDAQGIGLAATQVNVHQRVMIVDLTEDRSGLMVFINPQILWSSETAQATDEGCLSVPDVYD